MVATAPEAFEERCPRSPGSSFAIRASSAETSAPAATATLRAAITEEASRFTVGPSAPCFIADSNASS